MKNTLLLRVKPLSLNFAEKSLHHHYYFLNRRFALAVGDNGDVRIHNKSDKGLRKCGGRNKCNPYIFKQSGKDEG